MVKSGNINKTYLRSADVPVTPTSSGFTLIEMSIVLVIIGLIVGGILTGRDLIDAASQRAQISQIEKYNTAVHTFQLKYGYLPGDIPDPTASSFGFMARGIYAGEGDGNGVLEGNCGNTAGANNGFEQGCGEIAVFWVDLSRANLIDATILGYDQMGGNYPNINNGGWPNPTLSSSPASLYQWLPSARLGGQNAFVYIFSLNGENYFSVSTATKIGWNLESTLNPGLTVQQAYNIDSKIDDGLPQSGNVLAADENYQVWGGSCTWAAGNLQKGAGGYNCVPTTVATAYANTNCFDNSYAGGSAAIQKYQLQNATIQNCGLSFKFQ